MPSRSNRVPSVPQRFSPRRGQRGPAVDAESAHQRGQKRTHISTNGLIHGIRRKSARFQHSLDSAEEGSSQSAYDVAYQESKQEVAHPAKEQDEDGELSKRSGESPPSVLEKLIQARLQKSGSVNGGSPNLNKTADPEVLEATRDGVRGLSHQDKDTDAEKSEQKSNKGKMEKNSDLPDEKIKKGNQNVAPSDCGHPLGKSQDEEDSPARQRYPVRHRNSPQSHSETEKNCSGSSDIEKKSKFTGAKEKFEVPCPEQIPEGHQQLIQWLPSPVLIGFSLENLTYKCLKCALQFISLKNLIKHCIPQSKVPCYICRIDSDCTCNERIHYLTDHQFICLYCHERFSTQLAAKQHRKIIHPNELGKLSPDEHLTFHGEPPIDVSKQDNPSNVSYIVVLGRMKSVAKHLMPWIFGPVDPGVHPSNNRISVIFEKFLYRMNSMVNCKNSKEKSVMCPLCFQGFVGFDKIEDHMVGVHRPRSLKEYKTLIKTVSSPTTSAGTSSHMGNTPVSSSSSSSSPMLGPETTQSAFCHQCQRVFHDEASLGRHNIIVHSLSTIHRQNLAQKVTALQLQGPQGIHSGNAIESMPVAEKRLASSDSSMENTGFVTHKSHETCQSKCQKDVGNATSKESKDALDSSQNKTKDCASSISDNATKDHSSIVKSRKVDDNNLNASWRLPDALFTPTAIQNAPAPVIHEVHVLIKNALDILGVEQQVALRSPYATGERYKYSKAAAAFIMLKPVLDNPPQTPTARRNYAFKHKYKIPMGHLNPEFAECPLFPTLTDIYRRTNSYTMSPLRLLDPKEIKKSVPVLTKNKGKIARRFSKAVESAFMIHTQVHLAKVSRGHANIMRSSNIQAQSHLSVAVSGHVSERINKAAFIDYQLRSMPFGYVTNDPNQRASFSGVPPVSNVTSMTGHQEQGIYTADIRKPGPYHVLRGTPLQGQGPNVGGTHVAPQHRFFEMPVGNNRALFSVNAQGLATVVGFIPGKSNAVPITNPSTAVPLGYNRGSPFLSHTAAHGGTTSMNPQAQMPTNLPIPNPVKAHVTNSTVNPSAAPGQQLPVMTSYLAPANRNTLSADLTKFPNSDTSSGKGASKFPTHGVETVKEQLEKKHGMPKGIQQNSAVIKPITQEKKSHQNTVSNTTLSNRTVQDVMSDMRQLARNSVGPRKNQNVPKENVSDAKRPQQTPVQGPPKNAQKVKKVVLIPSAKGKKVTGSPILKRNAGKRVVQIKRKRIPSSDWYMKQLHIRMQQDSIVRQKNLWLHKDYEDNFKPTKEIKPVTISTSGVFCKAGSVDTVLTVSEAVKRAKRARIHLDDFKELCDKFAVKRTSQSQV